MTLNRKEHKDRKDLAGEHKWGDLGQIILLIVFLAVWIADSFVLKYSTVLSSYAPLYVRIPLAAIVLTISGLLAKAGLSLVFGEIPETPGVIRRGVFGIVRHPIYLGSVLLYLGLILFTLSIFGTVVWFFVIAFYHFLGRYEEKLLLAKFGGEYAAYMAEVPMWVPARKRK